MKGIFRSNSIVHASPTAYPNEINDSADESPTVVNTNVLTG